MRKVEASDSEPQQLRAPFDLHRVAIRRLYNANWAGLLLALVITSIVFSILTPYFATGRNVLNLSTAISYSGVTAAVTTLVLICGGLDLSISAVMALTGITSAQLLNHSMPWFAAIAVALMIGLIVGALNGLLVVKVGINPFIVTIGMQFLVRGVAYLISGASNNAILIQNHAFTWLGGGKIGGFPVSVIVLIASFLLVGWLLNFTRFGVHVKAIGGTAGGGAARLAGVAVSRQKMKIYMLSGTFAAVSGIVLAGYTTTGDPNAALGEELTIIAAVIIGGAALGGGVGSIIGTCLGILLLGVIFDGLTLLNVSSFWQYIVQGVALLTAVVVDEFRRRRISIGYAG